MLQKTVDRIEALTLSYWHLSRILSGKSKERITVEKAIESINTLEQNLGPSRPLLRCAKSLGDVIVQGKAKKLKKPATISILPQQVVTGGTNA